MLKSDTYTCAACRHVFLLDDRDRAESEAKRIVCDACFHDIWIAVHGTVPPGPVLH